MKTKATQDADWERLKLNRGQREVLASFGVLRRSVIDLATFDMQIGFRLVTFEFFPPATPALDQSSPCHATDSSVGKLKLGEVASLEGLLERFQQVLFIVIRIFADGAREFQLQLHQKGTVRSK